MKKNVLITLFLGLTMSVGFAQTALKVAVVDMNRVLKEYYKTDETENRLKDVASGYQKELNDRRDSYGKLVEQIRTLQEASQDQTLSETVRKEKQQGLEEKVKEAQIREQENKNFIQTATRLVQDQRRRANDNLMKEISKVVDSVSKAGGYNLVLVKSEFPSPVLYSDVADLSADIIKDLNKNKPKDSAKSEKTEKEPAKK